MRTGLLLALAACRHSATYVPPVPTALPADVPVPREGGPIAGPRAVVDQAPAAPVPEGTPGGGALPPWLAQLRAVVNARLDGCLAAGPATSMSGTALVIARYDATGAIVQVELQQLSGSEVYDTCLLQAFREARSKPPPPEALVEGQLVTPEMAFR